MRLASTSFDAERRVGRHRAHAAGPPRSSALHARRARRPSAAPRTGALAAVRPRRHCGRGYDAGARRRATPDSDLGTALRDVARLIKAEVGLQVACVDFGDWDMHVDLGGADGGWMHDQLDRARAARWPRSPPTSARC